MNTKVAGLVLLSVVPMLGGLARLFGLSTGRFMLEGHERFLADPLPAVLHIVGATCFATLGALQFLPNLRRTAWHRVAGRVLGGLGIAAALSGMWMAWRWPPREWDSPVLNALRVSVACAIVAFIAYSMVAARRREFRVHQVFMTRAYALWAAAGTHVLTLLPFSIPACEPMRSEGLYAFLIGLGWAINAAVAEWVIRSPRPATRGLEVPS